MNSIVAHLFFINSFCRFWLAGFNKKNKKCPNNKGENDQAGCMK